VSYVVELINLSGLGLVRKRMEEHKGKRGWVFAFANFLQKQDLGCVTGGSSQPVG